MFQARASSTTTKYTRAYQRWKDWVEKEHGGNSFPVSIALFALYLQHLGESTKSHFAVTEAVNAVAWVQRMAGVETVAQNHLIKSISEGFQKSLACPRKKKEPVTPAMLRELVASLGVSPSLSEVRLATICLLAYAAFLRIDELRSLRCCDVAFTQDGMEIHIAKSKTDQLRQGHTVVIASTNNPTCPVAMLRRYFSMAAIDSSSDLHLFRAISVCKRGEKLRTSGSLSYTRIRELVLEKIRSLGYDEKEFGLHSFRAGGATVAANDPTLPERLFKRHGRWQSEKAKDGYIKESMENRLRVSKSLGL